MPKIDNITYPDGSDDLLKDSNLGAMFRKFLKKAAAEENYLFLDETAKKIDPKKQYAIYFDDNGKYSVNVGAPIKLKAKALAQARDWKSREWKTLYKDARSHVNALLVQNFELSFYKSAEFKAYHARALRKAIKIPRALKEQLAMDDDSLLADTVVLFMSDKNLGKKAAKSLAAKKKSPRSPDEIGKAIMKFFKIR